LSAPIVDEVWSLDAVNQGDSALVNKAQLGDTIDWADNARDILSLLLYYMPSSATDLAPSPILERVPDSIAEDREQHGYSNRILVGLGHSFGGSSMARAAIAYPALFSSLILVDPVIISPAFLRGSLSNLVQAAMRRRSHWETRSHALNALKKSPFFQRWDSEALQVYIDHGLSYSPGEGASLKASPYQEAATFAERRVPGETWELLPGLNASVELYWIMAGIGADATEGTINTQQTVWRRPQNSSNVRISSAGHLIPQEAPQELAQTVYEFIRRKYMREEKRARL